MTNRIDAARLRELMDYDCLSGELRWRKPLSNVVRIGQIAGTKHNKGYRRVGVDGGHYYAHQLAWLYVTGEWPSRQIDHVDLDPANNRFGNLRLASPSQNHANRGRQKNNTSGFKGVTYNTRQRRWVAQIKQMDRHIHLGCFGDPASAHAAYAKAAVELFGDFARTA